MFTVPAGLMECVYRLPSLRGYWSVFTVPAGRGANEVYCFTAPAGILKYAHFPAGLMKCIYRPCGANEVCLPSLVPA